MLQKKNKKIFLYFIFFLVLGTLNNRYINKIDFLKFSKVNIQGLDEKERISLLRKLENYKNQNLLTLNQKKIQSIIQTIDIIEKYSIFKRYPSTIEIKITEAKFLAKTKKDGINFFIASNGKLINYSDEKLIVPFIFGNFENENFFKLKKIIDNSNFDYSSIKNLFVFPSGRWDIETKSGLLIKLPKIGIKESLDISLKLLKNDNLNKIKIIDIRQINQIIINE